MQIVPLSLSRDRWLIPGLHCSSLAYSSLVLGLEPLCVPGAGDALETRRALPPA